MRNIVLALTLLFSLGTFAEGRVPADTIRVRAFIDKEDVLHVQGDKVWFTHVIGAFPGQWGVDWPTYVNEIPWKPKWENDSKSDFFRMDNPLNFLPIETLSADKIFVSLIENTNSIAHVIEYPNKGNGWVLSIRLDNTRSNRALWMDLEISWKREANPKRKCYEIIDEFCLPNSTTVSIVPSTVPSPTPVGRR